MEEATEQAIPEPAGPAGPASPPVQDTTPKQLTGDGERLLLACFMLQDDLNPALSRLLAAQVLVTEVHSAPPQHTSKADCSAQHVHSFFSKLKTSVRNYVQRLQKKVGFQR